MRKLASVQKIMDLQPIANTIEKAKEKAIFCKIKHNKVQLKY